MKKMNMELKEKKMICKSIDLFLTRRSRRLRWARVLFLLIIFSPIASLFAQEYKYVPFPQSDAIWSEYYAVNDATPPVYERFALNGEDTIIGEHSYKKIYMFLDTVFDKNTATYVGGLREDSAKKVWFKDAVKIHLYKPYYMIPDSEEILLYDFSVNVGDTIKKGNFDQLYMNGDFPPIVVSQIDTVNIGNSLRKRFHFIVSGDSTIGEYHSIYVEWVEGIGSPLGLLTTPQVEHPTCTCNDGQLIEFQYKDEILYSNDLYSIFYSTAIQPVEKQSNTIFVKQLQNMGIQFDFGNNNISFLWIYDLAGKLQQSYNIKMQRELILPVNRFIPGIYIYKASDLAGNNYSGKFVIK